MRTNINNRDVRECVMRLEEFKTKTGSIFGEWNNYGTCFSVYSYSWHFPMYVWDATLQRWFGNSDMYNITTSKHQGIARPSDVHQWFGTKQMKEIAVRGFTSLIVQRMTA